MFTVSSYPIAIVMCVITMICWGSWANTQKLASKNWGFPLFYWDYSIGVLLFSLLLAFTMGSFGDTGRSFLADLSQADSKWLGSAFLGGVIFNISNILLVAAIDIAGLAVAFPGGVGLALVLGVITTYVATGEGNVPMLTAGVACVVIAIILDAIAYGKLGGSSKSSLKGIAISIAAGILMGFFYSFVAQSMAKDTGGVLEPGKLSPYTAVVLFSIGIFISNFVFNVFMMKKPLGNEGSRPAAEQLQRMQLNFRNPPISFNGSTFVNAVGQNGRDVNSSQMKHQKQQKCFVNKRGYFKIMRFHIICRCNNQPEIYQEERIFLQRADKNEHSRQNRCKSNNHIYFLPPKFIIIF